MGISIGLDVFGLALLMTSFALVVARRERTELHWLVLGGLSALWFWLVGDLLRGVLPEGDWSGAATRLMFVGVSLHPALWIALAANCAGVVLFKTRQRTLASLVLPPLLMYLLLLTNDAHHLFLRSDFNTGYRPAEAWAGPLFWGYVVWASLCGSCAGFLLLRHAHQLYRREEWWRGMASALAGLLPLALGSLYFFELTPAYIDFTPVAASVSSFLVVTVVLRDRLAAALPIAMRDVIENLREGVVLANPSGEVVAGNPAAQRIFGGSFSLTGGIQLAELLTALCGRNVDESLAGLVASDSKEAGPVTVELKCEDGRHIEVSSASIFRPDGEPVGRFAVLRDRTQKHRYERFLVQSQKLESIGVLAAGLAHEVNNPLAYVRANLSFLRGLGTLVEKNIESFEDSDAEALAEIGQIIDETTDGIERISKTVNGLRRFSRVPGEERAEMDVNEVVRDAVKLAELHRNRGVRVVEELASGLPGLLGSAERMEQVVLNLLLNAKQALAEYPDGEIRVTTASERGELAIRVADNGPGLTDEVKGRIFDPFFTTKSPDEGTGLGLSIAFDIVREHGGILELSSEDREGACFVIRFPLARDDAAHLFEI